MGGSQNWNFMPNIPEISAETQDKLDHTSSTIAWIVDFVSLRFASTWMGDMPNGLHGLMYNEKVGCILLSHAL